MQISLDALNFLLQRPEGPAHDFKEELPGLLEHDKPFTLSDVADKQRATLLRDLAALANAQSPEPYRYLVRGVTNQRSLVGLKGVSLIHREPDWQDWNKRHFEPPLVFTYHEVAVQEKQLGVFEVKRRPHYPHVVKQSLGGLLYEGQVWLRLGSKNDPAGSGQLIELYGERAAALPAWAVSKYPQLGTAVAANTFLEAIHAGQHARARGLLGDYLALASSQLLALRVGPSQNDQDWFLGQLEGMTPMRDEFVAVVAALLRYGDAAQANLGEQLNKFFGSLCEPYSVAEPGPMKFVVGEMFLHTSALLFREREIAAFSHLIGRDFVIPGLKGTMTVHFGLFYHGLLAAMRVEGMADGKEARLALAELLERRTPADLARADVLTADLLLCLRSARAHPDTRLPWRSATIYRWGADALPAFVQAEDEAAMGQLVALAGADLPSKLLEMLTIWVRSEYTDFDPPTQKAHLLSWFNLARLKELFPAPPQAKPAIGQVVFERLHRVFDWHGLDLGQAAALLEPYGLGMDALADPAATLRGLAPALAQITETLQIAREYLMGNSEYPTVVAGPWYKYADRFCAHVAKLHKAGRLACVHLLMPQGGDLERAYREGDGADEVLIGIILERREPLGTGGSDGRFSTFEYWQCERWSYAKSRLDFKAVAWFLDNWRRKSFAESPMFMGTRLRGDAMTRLHNQLLHPAEAIRSHADHGVWYPEDYASGTANFARELEEYPQVMLAVREHRLDQLLLEV